MEQNQGDRMNSYGIPIFHCPFDGLRCRIFEALRLRERGLYFAIGCVIDKKDNNFHKCSRYVVKKVNKKNTHHCPFDGDFCKHVRGCQDVFFFSNGLPLSKYCYRAKIKRKIRWS